MNIRSMALVRVARAYVLSVGSNPNVSFVSRNNHPGDAVSLGSEVEALACPKLTKQAWLLEQHLTLPKQA